ncbi:hypothetical protein G6321_00031315 [Bradyrhizobium barranii subsp. barranii]|uniref:Uncharacterized protein n=1 Tax=Bradyrhizobium barranii subsp. barranii TaxID=2823807 RepID=A0A7Z0QG13_9BRAD|nr:hypothetical protein [Bradyrhizobium barranii]UGX90326.1 hypothetical protein G6321_00031315 [Bradyrhizobium barranii subsp. barranii]
MADYKIVFPNYSVQRRSDGATIPFDPANRDYREYLAWLDAGGVPDPADDPPPPKPFPDPPMAPKG